MDFIEEYMSLLEQYKKQEKSEGGKYSKNIRFLTLKKEDIHGRMLKCSKDKRGYLEDKIKKRIKTEVNERYTTLDYDISCIKKNIEKLENQMKEEINNLDKEQLRTSYLNKKKDEKIFLEEVNGLIDQYEGKIPENVKKSVSIYEKDTEYQIEDFDVENLSMEEYGDFLDDLESQLYLRLEEVNSAKIDRMINTIFILKPEYLEGWGALATCVWYIVIMVGFILFCPILIPLYLAFVLYIGIISFIAQTDIRNCYKTLLALREIAEDCNAQVEKEVDKGYYMEVSNIKGKYERDIEKNYSILDEKYKERDSIPKTVEKEVNSDKGTAKLYLEIEDDKKEFERQLQQLDKDIEEQRELQEKSRKELSEKKEKLHSMRERLEKFLSHEDLANTRLYRSIYMNGILVGFDGRDPDKPIYLSHNKRCSLLFYDGEKDKNSVIGFVMALFYNTLMYMQDGTATIDLVDTEDAGISFTQILPTDEEFDNDKEKIDKYCVKLKTKLDDYFKELKKDIEVRMELMPRSGIDSIDAFNEDKLAKKAGVLSYRIPVFYKYKTGTLTDEGLKNLVRVTSSKTANAEQKNLGIIPIICIPYQYFIKESGDIILDFVEMVGRDNIFCISRGDLVKCDERDLADIINDCKYGYDKVKKSLHLE